MIMQTDFFSTKPDSAGNGLGLGFCERAMNSFNGSINVNSIEGEFTEFILFFPRIDKP